MNRSSEPNRRLRIVGIALLIALVPATWVGWRAFWFQTDDAHIAFRYVTQSLHGHGFVWNAPPFRPVEGYTSFLFIALLDAIWRLTGIAPPAASNAVLLAFGYGTLALSFWIGLRMRLSEALKPVRLALVALALAGVVANRTFLAWTSSGLETQMFNLFVTAWVAFAVLLPGNRVRTVAALSVAASLIALTRPDGLLFVAATIGLAAGWAWFRFLPPRRALIALSPLLLVVGHMVWRRSFYGLWVPNTYYAKIGGIWPAAGFRYLLSFLIEYAFWIWGVVLLVVVARALRRGGSWSWADRLGPVVVCGTIAFHIGYYTVKVGGDHFEYRILSYLVPLAFLSLVRLLSAAGASAPVALGATLTLVLASLPIPWVHWSATKDLTTRDQTHVLAVRIAPRFPRLARPYVEIFDDLQQWLIPRHIGMRHQEHKVFAEWLGALPPRSTRPRPTEGFPVVVSGTPGVMFWDYPEINVLDSSGLNDAVIARSFTANRMFLKMAHDRVAPPGYIECFRPNVSWEDFTVRIFPRPKPLTAEDIHTCESTAWKPVRPASHLRPPEPREAGRGDGCFVSDRDMVAHRTRDGLEWAVRFFARADHATARQRITEDPAAEVLPAGSVLCPLERRRLAGEVRVRVGGRDEPVWTLAEVLP